MLKLIQLESLLKADGLGHSSTDIHKLFEKIRKDGKISNANRESAIKSDGPISACIGLHNKLVKANCWGNKSHECSILNCFATPLF